MNFGLSPSDFKLLNELVLLPLKKLNVSVYVFGSRATGKNQLFSDLDLLLEPAADSSFNSSFLSDIKEAIEESRFSVKVDFVMSNDLASSYRDKVHKERIRIEHL